MTFILLLSSLWADPNMTDPAMRDEGVQGGVPCLTDCRRPTPSQMLLDATTYKNTDPKQDNAKGDL